jgi:hypothetical protein
MSVESKTDLLTTQRSELIKSYTEFDIESRVEYIYTAPTDAVHNTPCSVVQYVYIGANSQQILAMKEGKARWDGAWDTAAVWTVSSTLPVPLP